MVSSSGNGSTRSNKRRRRTKTPAVNVTAAAATTTTTTTPVQGTTTTRRKQKETTGRVTREKRQANTRRRASTIEQRRRKRLHKIRNDERQQQQQQQQSATTKNSKKGGSGPREVVQNYYEMEKIVGKRLVTNKRVEYLIRWKGCPESDNTWEPVEHLCDSGYAEARRFTRELNARKKQMEIDEQRLGLKRTKDNANKGDGIRRDMKNDNDDDDDDDDDRKPRAKSKDVYSTGNGGNDKKPSASNSLDAVDEECLWRWTDEEQIVYRNVVRIHVDDADAAERVTEARESGIPIVLVGHVGWANFAKRWLMRLDDPQGRSSKRRRGEGTYYEEQDESLLDLSQPHRLDVARMILDIGDEEVPVVRRDYDEANPIHGSIQVKKFLTSCWCDTSRAAASTSVHQKRAPKLYLHQWQFPLSDTAGRKLCHQNNPLPNDVLGEDLLKYWLDLEQCKGDSVYQYLFMGNEGTMSKLHKDNGGMAISIAPIVGQKECVLVHRVDGARCLYHLDAKLDDVDLQTYPLVSQARIWKTTISPGEILLMPHGTYHQCRNATPCLSYSRFHLDTVNMVAFLHSMIDGDAREIEHEEIIWNCASALVNKVDAYVDKVQKHVRSPASHADASLSDCMLKMVKTLRFSLLPICREIARRKMAQQALKRPSFAPVQLKDDPIGEDQEESSDPAKAWETMTDEIDFCLHYFRHRRELKPPRPLPRPYNEAATSKVLPKISDEDTVGDTEQRARGTDASIVSNSTHDDSAANNGDFHSVPHIADKAVGLSMPSDVELAVNDCVVVHWMGKRIIGKIMRIEPEMRCALLTYEEFSAFYDEYQPIESLRLPVSGEVGIEIDANEAVPGLLVLNRWGALGEEYRAMIQSTTTETFYRVQLDVRNSFIDRWLTRESIVKRLVTPVESDVLIKASSSFHNTQQNVTAESNRGDEETRAEGMMKRKS